MNDFTGKRLLVLGGASQCIKVVNTAKEMGIYTIVADINPDALAKKYADEALDMSLLDMEALLNWCRHNPIDGIINICVDAAQKTRYYLCNELGLPNYGSPDSLKVLTDKDAFKQTCRSYGVDVIPEYTLEELDNGQAQYPVFVKPAECSGSRGMSVCYNKEQLEAAVSKAKDSSRNDSFLIEKYIDSPFEFMVTYVFINGEAYLERTTDRYTGKKADGLGKVSVLAVSPSKYEDMFLTNVNDKLVRMLKGMGITNGPVFMQGFVDGNTIRFFDPAMRLPGANYELILKQATGIDIMSILIQYALTGEMDDIVTRMLRNAYKLNGKMAAIVFPVMRAGVIGEIEGLESIGDMDSVIGVYRKHREGQVIEATGDISQRIAEIDILCDTKEQLVRDIQHLRDMLTVKNIYGEEMITSNSDLTLLE